jgi:TRAP-type C4-dicarboxylate transport system permease small subunit
MLYLCWLMFRGGWQQTVINWPNTSAVMQVSMGWFYASGVFFAVFAFLFILVDLVKLVSGRLSDADLIGVSESDEMPRGEPEPAAK